MIRKHKKVLILLVSFLFIGVVFLLLNSSVLRAEDEQPGSIASDVSLAYRQALLSPLEEATGEVTDPEIAQFTTKLVQSYGLDQIAENPAEDELANLLPDIKKIHKSAMDLPLKEAGKQLKDKELSEFYNSFIQSIGVE